MSSPHRQQPHNDSEIVLGVQSNDRSQYKQQEVHPDTKIAELQELEALGVLDDSLALHLEKADQSLPTRSSLNPFDKPN